MIAKVLFWILVVHQFASRSNSTSLKPAIPVPSPPSVSGTSIPTTYSLNRTVKGSKFNGFGNDNYNNDYTTQIKQHTSNNSLKKTVSKYQMNEMMTHTSINDTTFGSISLSGFKNIIFLLLLSVLGACIFVEFQQRKTKNLADKHVHVQPVEPVACNNDNNNNNISNIIHINPLPNTQIILDYDDTLFPTAYTDNNIKNGINSSKCISQHEWDELYEIRDTVYQILLLFIELFGASNVCIVTNARLLWLNQSCTIYNGLYEKMRSLIINQQIQVLSATDSYRSQKSSAFMAVLRNKNNINKVICIGDSLQEYDDIDTVCSVLRLRRRRTGQNIINYSRFKLNELPSLNVMIRQLHFLKKLNYHSISQQKYDQSYQLNI